MKEEGNYDSYNGWHVAKRCALSLGAKILKFEDEESDPNVAHY